MWERHGRRSVGVSRRGLLKWAGVGLGAALTGCRVEASNASGSANIQVSRWSDLAGRLSGGLILPGEPAYDDARLSYNPLCDDQFPSAVARCARPEDVQACIEFARRERIRLAARSGGHSYAGYSTPDRGLVADVGPMNDVLVDADGTATIGAGARLADIYATLGAAGRCIPGGSCPSVGVSGLTLGGGIGVLSRLHGLTCDSLLAADVVLADGTRRTVSMERDPDLFWALRGGGGGNFGIVTSFRFRTYEAPSIVVFRLQFAPETIAEVLDAWQSWIPSLPKELWSNCKAIASDMSCRIGGSFVGSEADLEKLLDGLRARVRPTASFKQTKSYLDAMRYFAGCEGKTNSECRLETLRDGGELSRASFVASSRIVSSPIAAPDRIVALLKPIDSMDLIFDSLGGAVGALAPDATAFPHRHALASVQVYKGTSPSGRSSAVRVVGEVQAALASIVGGGAYINYIDPNQADWAAASYGANLTKLREVATRYDPDNFFGFAQGVAPITSSTDCVATGRSASFSSINEKYQDLGGCASALGRPLSDEQDSPDGIGGFRAFEHGSIYWTAATGAHAVLNAILDKWGSVGWELGVLGYPTTDELDCADGIGRFNIFQRGSIYWSPTTGAHVIGGAIRERWGSLGWEVGELGYPISDEFEIPTGRQHDFERGSITWNAATGRTEVLVRG